MDPVIPDLDVWVRAFGRLDPDPRVVHAFRELVRSRRILVTSWIRVGLLARIDDERQAMRLAAILAGYPEVAMRGEDHLRAAELVRSLRRRGQALPERAAMLWAAALRAGAGIWSLDRRWLAFARAGAPFAEISPSPPGRVIAPPR